MANKGLHILAWKCLIILAFGAGIFSCTDNEVDGGYLAGKFRLDFATVRFESGSPILALDSNDTLRAGDISYFTFTKKDGQRVVVNHSPDEGNGITIHSIADVLTSHILTGKLDTLHADPVKIQSIWVEGGYVNLILSINRYSKAHVFGLYRTTSAPNVLQLSHDKQGDSEGYPVKVYMSFLLNGLQRDPATDSIFFSVTVPTSSGLKRYPLSMQ
jgi:hypothetical protein